MSENLYIKGHRYTNPEFRDEYERIFGKDTRKERAMELIRLAKKWQKDNLERDIQEEMEKGQVTGHFV